MKRLLFAAVTATLAVGAAAQQPAQPNPRDAVPDKMPNDIPYGAPISLDRAQAAVNAAVAEAKKRGWKLNVAVMDSGANLVAFARMDGAQLGSIAIAEHKARAAVKYRRETNFNALCPPPNTITCWVVMSGSASGRWVSSINRC